MRLSDTRSSVVVASQGTPASHNIYRRIADDLLKIFVLFGLVGRYLQQQGWNLVHSATAPAAAQSLHRVHLHDDHEDINHHHHIINLMKLVDDTPSYHLKQTSAAE